MGRRRRGDWRGAGGCCKMREVARRLGWRRQKVGMVSAVGAGCALAYADLRREETRAIEDFTREQVSLARVVAAALARGTQTLDASAIADSVRALELGQDPPPMRVLVVKGGPE